MTEIPITVTADMMIKKNPLSFRHEEKHPINKADCMELESRLSRIFKRDVHSDSHGFYRVSSLYFDTPDDKALRQKIDGVNMREKFRLRYYNEDFSFLRLEKKIKINGMCAKQSTELTLQQGQSILKGDICFLKDSGNPLMLELYSKIRGQLLVPKTVVCYDREAFTYVPGNVRITIDSNLRTGREDTDFFNINKLYVDVSDDCSVLEVKYDRFLPDIVRMAVQLHGRRSAAYSKYAECRRFG